jgi:hypothetical protein
MSSSPTDESTTPRRQFLGELAAGAAALAAVACAPAATAAPSQAPTPAPAPANGNGGGSAMAAAPMQPLPPQSSLTWDSSWMGKISARHKAVFDSPEINDGTALYHAMSYLGSVKDVFGTNDSDASVVVVLRHRAVPMLFNDAMWEKYDIGTETKTTDEKTKKVVTRNVFYQALDKEGKPASDEKSSPTIKSLTNRGVIFIGCDLATRGFSYRIAQKTKQEQRAVYEEIKQNLVPGATLMPTGVFGMLLAQEAGCSVMRST